eukprot:7168080-Prymnesium_polylepis.1
MFTARVASEPGGTKCAIARKYLCAAPNVLHVHTPATTLSTPPEHLERSVGFRTFRGAQTERGADALARLFCNHRRRGRG